MAAMAGWTHTLPGGSAQASSSRKHLNAPAVTAAPFLSVTERVVTFWEPRGSSGMASPPFVAAAAEAEEFSTRI